jgi:H+-translocating NAD(P) transhydrogenase subunit alpha
VSLEFVLAIYVFLLTIFLGIELINRVPATLHTPLMSATNAIHGIVLIGAMLVAGAADSTLLHILGLVGVILGAGNAVGGFAVTDRMLEMFKKKPVEGQQ